jgi:hypothetical protein
MQRVSVPGPASGQTAAPARPAARPAARLASKEDLALSFIRDSTDAFVRELAARPRAEPPTSGDGSVESMLAAFDACAAQLKPALLEHWA